MRHGIYCGPAVISRQPHFQMSNAVTSTTSKRTNAKRSTGIAVFVKNM